MLVELQPQLSEHHRGGNLDLGITADDRGADSGTWNRTGLDWACLDWGRVDDAGSAHAGSDIAGSDDGTSGGGNDRTAASRTVGRFTIDHCRRGRDAAGSHHARSGRE